MTAGRIGRDLRFREDRFLTEHPHFNACAPMVVSPGISFDNLPDTSGENRFAIVQDAEINDKDGRQASIELRSSDLNPVENVEQYVVFHFGGSALAYNTNVRSELPAESTNRVRLTVGSDPS